MILGSILGTVFEEEGGRLPVEEESDMWTPKNSDFDTLKAPKKHQIWGYVLMQIW